MNILITTPSLNLTDNVSGISSITRLLIRYNTKEKYFPFILGRRDGDKRGVFWLLSIVKMPFRLCRFIRKHAIDMAHFSIGFEPPSLLRDIIPYLILFYKQIPLCLHIHGGRYMADVPANGLLRMIIVLFLKKASEIVVLSDMEAEYLKTQYLFLTDRRINVVSNSVEIPEDKSLDKRYTGVLNLLYLGRIDRKKGLDVIAVALNDLAEKEIPFQFYLCGVGPDKDWFMALLNERAGASMVDKGLVCGEEKKRILQQSHLFLLPSLFEGLPMALLESMGYAILPIVSPVGSIPDVVKDRVNGLIVEDAASVVSAVISLDADRETLKAMALASRETIRRGFSITTYVDQINGIYLQVGKKV